MFIERSGVPLLGIAVLVRTAGGQSSYPVFVAQVVLVDTCTWEQDICIVAAGAATLLLWQAAC